MASKLSTSHRSVSESTVYRKTVTASVSRSLEIREGDLDNVVEEITREYPSCGEVLFKQILADWGIEV